MGTDENLFRLVPMPGHGARSTASGASAHARARCPELYSGTNKRLCTDWCPEWGLGEYIV